MAVIAFVGTLDNFNEDLIRDQLRLADLGRLP